MSYKSLNNVKKDHEVFIKEGDALLSHSSFDDNLQIQPVVLKE